MPDLHPDRVPITYLRQHSETVGDMIREGWVVIAVCSTCHIQLDVNLRVIAALKGPKVSLWCRSTKCKRVGCVGRARFHGRHPMRASFELLSAPYPDRPSSG